ncbi:MAG: hypothetical protein ACYDBT_17650 [Desulfobulbaceae bacterium]
MLPHIVFASRDAGLAQTACDRLRQWGLTVSIKADFTLGGEMDLPGRDTAVALLDIRGDITSALQWLRAAKKEQPGLEVLLINQSEHIEKSMAGMHAGASDELTLPLDLSELRRKIMAALLRWEKRSGRKRKKSLVLIFQEAMTAAAYAQAGDFDTAKELLRKSEES